jgi:hypothetical protein
LRFKYPWSSCSQFSQQAAPPGPKYGYHTNTNGDAVAPRTAHEHGVAQSHPRISIAAAVPQFSEDNAVDFDRGTTLVGRLLAHHADDWPANGDGSPLPSGAIPHDTMPVGSGRKRQFVDEQDEGPVRRPRRTVAEAIEAARVEEAMGNTRAGCEVGSLPFAASEYNLKPVQFYAHNTLPQLQRFLP